MTEVLVSVWLTPLLLPQCEQMADIFQQVEA